MESLMQNLTGVSKEQITINHDNNELEEYIESLKNTYSLNRRILLVQLPQLQLESFSPDIARTKSYYAFPPAGLQWVAKSLEGRNFDVDILDLNYCLLKNTIFSKDFDYNNWISILNQKIGEFKPSIIGTTCINVSKLFNSTNPFNVMLSRLKEINRHLVIVGGASIMNDYEACLEKGLCHFVIDGEGEDRINFLLDKIFGESCSQPTARIFFKFREGIAETKGTNKRICLHGNLISTYKRVPVEEYFKVGVLNHYSRMAGDHKPFATLQLGRGCRMNCKFCGVPKFIGRGVYNHPCPDLIEEINYLVKEKGIRHFEWLDDDLLAGRDALKEILKELIRLRKNYGITWAANNGLISAFLTDEMLGLMRDSGCVGFKIGIESGNPEILRKIRKPATIETILKSCKLINGYPEMFVAGNYIIGFFGEEPFWQMLDTFRLSCRTNLDWSSISVFQFTSTETAIKESLNKKDLGDTAVIPARYRPDGKVMNDGKNVVCGPEIFNIGKDAIPSPDQVRQIWFTFNLVGNYFNNKNLRTRGNPVKFASWVEILEITYPHNAYMPLFAALAYTMAGNKQKRGKQLTIAKKNLQRDPYWQHKFDLFELTKIIAEFPENPQQVQGILEPLRQKYSQWTD